jgi:hypothetical protein
MQGLPSTTTAKLRGLVTSWDGASVTDRYGDSVTRGLELSTIHNKFHKTYATTAYLVTYADAGNGYRMVRHAFDFGTATSRLFEAHPSARFSAATAKKLHDKILVERLDDIMAFGSAWLGGE